ncbi:hypothetical protein UlMin_014551 [Ulmus minor]
MESTSPKHFLTFLFLGLFYINSALAARNPTSKINSEFIRTACKDTTYPKICFSSLSSHANTIQTSPHLLTSTALNVTLSSAKSTSDTMLKLSRSHGIKPREAAAMRDCIEELNESVTEIQRSIGEMRKLKERDFKAMVRDVQTWVSAALTDENTCSDGFQGSNMNGDLKKPDCECC